MPQAAQRAGQFGARRQHIVGLARMKHSDGNNARGQRVEIAGNHLLERGHDGGARQDDIDAPRLALPHGSLLPTNRDLHMIGRGHDRAVPQGESTQGKARQIVHAKDLLDAEPLHQPIIHHGLTARAALFRRLKNHDGRPCEGARLRQMARRAEQHCRVPVMPAGMHEAGTLEA